MSQLSPADAALKQLLEEAEAQTAPELNPSFRDALNAFIPHVDEDPVLLGRLGQALVDVSMPIGAGLLAAASLGASVEHGADPSVTAKYVIETFAKWGRKIKTCSDNSEDPDSAVIEGLQYLGRAAVAHLVRLPEYRAQLQDDDFTELLSSITHLSWGATWVETVLQQRSGELIVLHGEKNIGVKIRYENLCNCAQFFTLFQGAIGNVFPGAGELDGQVLALARGQYAGEYFESNDSAWWHYGQPVAGEPNMISSVWIEANMGSIAEIEGQQVMLVWPPILQGRSWHTNFFPPFIQATPPSVEVVKKLSYFQARRLRSKLS